MRIFVFVTALALAGCQPAPDAIVQAETVNACPASATSNWTAAAGVVFSVEAAVVGADCTGATATFSVRDASGAAVLTEAYPVNEVMTLAGAESVADMERRLGEWIIPAGAMADSTGDLPEWRQGEARPMSGEFPFYPDEGVDRTAYEALRARDATMLCYVQGMESLACLAWDNGRLEKVGLQTFPG
jgi:hypothetical protein